MKTDELDTAKLPFCIIIFSEPILSFPNHCFLLHLLCAECHILLDVSNLSIRRFAAILRLFLFKNHTSKYYALQ